MAERPRTMLTNGPTDGATLWPKALERGCRGKKTASSFIKVIDGLGTFGRLGLPRDKMLEDYAGCIGIIGS